MLHFIPHPSYPVHPLSPPSLTILSFGSYCRDLDDTRWGGGALTIWAYTSISIFKNDRPENIEYGHLDRAVELTIAPSYNRFVGDGAIDGAMAMERWCDGSIKHCAIVIARSCYRHRVIASWSPHHRVIVIAPSHHRVIVIAPSLSRNRTIALEVDSTIAR